MTENVQNKLALLESKRLSLLDTCTWFMEVKENKDGIQLIVQKKIIDDKGKGQIIKFDALKSQAIYASQDVIYYMLSGILDDMGNSVGLQELVNGRITFRGRIPLDSIVGHKMALISILLQNVKLVPKMEVMAWRIERMTFEEVMYWLSKVTISSYGDGSKSWARIGLRVMLAGPTDRQENFDDILSKLRR